MPAVRGAVRARAWSALALAALLVLAGCSGGGHRHASSTTTTAAAGAGAAGAPGGGAGTPPPGDQPSVELAVGDHPRGGSVRVGVTFAPDPGAPTLGGAAVRALVLPQLFVPRPDGRWAPMLVEAGSDRTAADALSATFRLRAAAWSDGRPVTADDLRRTADTRFVAGVDGPAPDGTVTVRFVHALPGWRRLWSGADAIGSPAPGVWGGPFSVASATPGLETVLARNPGWPGPGPFLDEVHLVLVPDATTQRQLLARGELDVVAPLASTVRVEQLRTVAGVSVDVAHQSGWWVGLRLAADRLDDAERAALVASFPRDSFVDTLLQGEATRLDGFAGPEDAAWAGGSGGGSAGGSGGGSNLGALKDATVDLVGTEEESMTWLVHRAMQKNARAAGGTIELRQAEDDRVEGWLRDGTFDAAVVPEYDPPVVCWTCRWGAVDADLAARADSGDATAAVALEGKLRDGHLVRPLWRAVAAVAWRSDPGDPGGGDGLGGVAVNGYALSAAWNAWAWWRA